MTTLPTFVFLVFCFSLPASGADESIRHIGKVLHPPVNEMSGIAKSVTYQDVWWVHNDSGSDPRLFALDGKGRVIMPDSARAAFRVENKKKGGGSEKGKKELWPGLEVLGAHNVDWEDIAVHDGSIYIADLGNNLNARRDLGIYVVREPNPRVTTKARVLKFIPVAYPDQDEFPPSRLQFDCEGFFFSDEKIYLLSKHRNRIGVTVGGTKLYRLDTEYSDRVNVAKLVSIHPDFDVPTSARLSPDSNHLCVLTYSSLWVFARPKTGDDWLSGRSRKILLPMSDTRQVEGVCWVNDGEIRFSNEQRDLYQVSLDSLKATD